MSSSNPFIKTQQPATSRIFMLRIRMFAQRVFLILLVAALGTLATMGTVSVAKAALLYAPSITATKTDSFVGGDGDGKADLGETIRYATTISNGGTAATGVTFNDIIDLNTTLVGGSLNVSPLAVDDTYDTIGNTLLDVGVGVPDPAVHVVAGGLFLNDTEFLGDTYTLKSVEADTTAPFTTATESGGSVTVNADINGTFTYIPPVGFSGADHFDYVITDDGPDNIAGNADDLTGAGRVTINVTTQRVWYVKNDVAGAGSGLSTDPFKALASAQGASAANDTIYVFQGNNTTSSQNAGIVLKNGQRLLGEAVALTILIPSGSFNGVPAPTTVTLKTGVPANRPKIGNAAGDGVAVSTVSIGATFSGVEIRGLDISGTGAGTNAVDVTTSGAFGGSFELADNLISAAGLEGIDVNGVGTTALTVNLHDNTVTASGNGIDISRAVGAASVNIIAFDDNVVTGATGGIGINIVGGGVGTVLFDTDPSTASYVGNTVSGGNTVIGSVGAGNGAGTSGMVLTNVKGDLSFTNLDIYTDNGAALSIAGTTSNFLTSGTGSRVTANTGTPTLVAVNGPALSTNQTNINIVPTTFSSITSATTGVSLVETSGTFSAPSGSSITDAAGTDFSIDGNLIATATVSATYAGTITDNTGRLVQVQDVTGGSPTYIFSGAISGSGATSTGVFLDNNDSATIRFSGGLALSTSTNPAFTATNGATAIEVCDDNPCAAGTGSIVNTLTTTSGTPLTVTNSTIGANDLEFRSISSNGAANGIVLDTTGSSGGLVVNGTGSGFTGGTIQSSTGDGVRLISTTGATLKYMNITGSANSGVRGELSTNISLQNLSVTSNSNAASNCTEAAQATCEAGIYFVNMLGSSNAISNTTVSGSFEDNIHVQNFNSNVLGGLAISSCTVSNNNTSSGNIGIHVMAAETSNMTVSIASCLLQGNRTDSINADGADSSTLHVTITGNTIIKGTAGNNQGNIGIDVTAAASATVRFRVDSNSIGTDDNFASKKPLLNTGINVFDGTAANSTMTGVVINNKVQNDDVSVPASSSNGFGIRAFNSNLAAMQVLIDGNKVRGINTDYGILAESSGTASAPGAGLGLAAFGVTNNDVQVRTGDGTAGTPGGFDDIRLQARNFNSICARVTGNDTAVGGFSAGGTFGLVTRQANSAVFNLEGGAANLGPNNPLAGSTTTFGTITTVATNSCATIPSSGFVAMAPNNNHILAQAWPGTNPLVVAQAPSVNTSTSSVQRLTAAKTFTTASVSGVAKLSKQAAWAKASNVVLLSGNFNSGTDHLVSAVQPAPARSGESVGPVSIGTLPAGKSVTVQYDVTVDNPIDNPVGATKILNQSTISGSNFSNVLTTDTGPGPDCTGPGTETCTLIDRPDATVLSINRQTPSAALTNATSVVWRVTFDTPVAGLAVLNNNFTLTDVTSSITGESISSIVAVTGSPDTQWDVTVNTGTGDGTLRLDMVTDTNLSHDVFVPPGSPNALPFTGQVYNIDKTAPVADMFDRFNPSTTPTNADTLIFQAIFSEDVTGVDAADFTVPALTGDVINVSPVSASVYNVTVSGGDLPGFNGLVDLDFNSPTIADLAGNALSNTTVGIDKHYMVDNTAPTVTINQAAGQSDPTNASPINFTAVFSEDVGTSFITGDVTVSGTAAPTTGTVTEIAPFNGTTYNVAVSGMTGDGTVIASILANKAQDLAGNDNAAATFTDHTVTYDATAPTVTINQAVGQLDPTNASPINFTVVFSESVGTSFITGDVTMGGSAGATTGTVTEIAPFDGTTYNVAVSGMTGDGTVIASILTNKAQDLAGNNNTASSSTDGTVTYDTTAPTVTIDQASGQSDPTATSPISFTVVFSQAVTGFATGDVDLSASTAPGTLIGTVSGGPTTYNVDVSGMTGDGTVIASILANKAQDLAGNNNIASTSTDNSVLYDTVPPSVTINQAAGQSDPTNASPINFTAVFSESVGTSFVTGDVTVSGTAAPTTGTVTEIAPFNGTTYNVAVSGMTGDGTVIASILANKAQDLGGNDNSASTSTDHTVTYDTTAPTVTINQAAGQNDPTNASPINFTAVFSEDVGTSFITGDVTLTGTAAATTGTVTEIAPFDGTTYNVAVSGMTGDGTVIASILANKAQDLAGNNNTAATFTDHTVTYDATAPTVTINQAAGQSDPTATTPINFTAVFSEDVGASFVTGDVTLSGSAGATTATVTEIAPFDGTTYNVAASGMTGDGFVIASILANKAQDLAGNNNIVSSSTDNSVLYDTVPPSVTINQAVGQVDPTSANPINFTAVFSEAVTGFGDLLSDVTLTGTASATVTSITEIAPMDGTTYTVAVTATSNGTVIASIPANKAQDLASQPNTASTSTDHTVTYVPPTDLSITKTDGVITATPGGSVTYTITASNAGLNADPAATVADTFPASLTANWTCVGAGGGTCTASGAGNINDTVNLPVGASVTYTATATISASATGTLSNTATVTTGSSVADTNPGNNSATDSDTLTPQADLSITKTDGVTTATPGGSVTYTITASNAGPSNAPGATVGDTFPAILTANWTCVGAGGGTCAASGAGNINDTVNLPAGGSVTYTVSATISAAATGTLSNTATVTAPAGVTDPTPGNNSATDTDTLTPQADLSITKTDGVITAAPGGSVTYTITASNPGPSDAPGATVGDTFPASLTANWTCVGAGGGTCTASGAGNINDTVNLPAGGSVTYTVSATISAAATGSLSNTATVTAPAGVTDPTPGNNSATDTDTLAPQADLSITKTDGSAIALAGNSVTYTITASNAGPSNVTGVTVADTFPASLTGMNWTCVGAGGGTCTASGAGNINSATVNLPAGGSVTYTATATLNIGATGTLSNTATVSSGVTDPTPANNSATDSDTIVPPVAVTINQASGQSDPTNNGVINFTAVFASAVTDFDDLTDVTLTGTASATVTSITEIAPMNGTTYTVTVNATSDGTVIATIPAGVATGSQGQSNLASTSTDHTVTYDTTAPNVTINQAVGQPDTTSASPVHFTVVFNEPVTGFDGTDVTLSGSANPTTASVTPPSGPATTYDVAVSGMNASGTITVSIPSGSAMDAANNFNNASTTTTPGVTDTISNYTYTVAPVITEGATTSVTMSEDGSPTAFALTLHASDANSDPLTWSILSQGTHGTASAAPGPANSSVINYTPLPNYNGADSFVVQVSDGALSDTITVNVTIKPVTYHGGLLYNQSYDIKYDTWFGVKDVNALADVNDFASINNLASLVGPLPSGYRKATSGDFTFKPNYAFTSFTWVSYRGPDQGKAQVLVDGTVKATIDLYRATVQWQYPVVINGLTNAHHTVIVRAINAKNPASSNKWVVVDGFKIGSTTYDDDTVNINIPGLFTYGTWVGQRNIATRFGAYRVSGSANATIISSFNGKQVTWTTARGPAYGQAQMWVDGVLKKTVNLYNASQQWQYPVTVTGLAYGPHTVVIKVLGTKSPLSTGTGVVCDGFVIE